jgi:hypothetical protein
MKIIILFIIYIIAILLSVLYTCFSPKQITKGENEIYTKCLYNIKNYDKITSFFKEKLMKYSKQINYDKMSYDEWFKNISKEYIIKLDNEYIYYFFIYEKLADSDIMLINLAYDNTAYKDTTSRFDFKQYMSINNDRLSESPVNILDDSAYNMFCYSEIGQIRDMNFYWIDPYYYNAVVKNSFFTKWKTTDGREGIIGIGFDTYNLTYEDSYKVVKNVRISEIIVSSFLLFTISLMIFVINANSFSKIESIIILIISHVFITYYINTTDYYSNYESERQKLLDINSGIQNISFLSAINIFIIYSIYIKNSPLFKETSYIFAIATIFLLMACYKSTNQNVIEDITKARYTNQYLFNLSVILNFFIIINYVFYSFIFIKK